MTKDMAGMMPALKDRRGLSLVEVMIAMVVLLFVSLALMQTALVSIESNMKNVLRDEAVVIAEERINRAKAIGFGNLTTGDTTPLLPAPACPANFVTKYINGQWHTVSLKGISNFGFCSSMWVTSLGNYDRRVDVFVGWNWKGVEYNHDSTAIVRDVQ